jgi:Domain of unknown function (DUF4352)
VDWIKKHKILTVILAIVVLAGIGGAAGGGKTTTSNGSSPISSENKSTGENKTSSNEKTYKFDDRADKQPKDVEVLPSETATVGGVKLTLSGIEYKTALNDFETADSGKTYVTADVALENTSKETKPYNVFDFRIQTAAGQVLDGAFSTITTLGSGDMVSGGKATGKIVFEVPVEEGHQYVI